MLCVFLNYKAIFKIEHDKRTARRLVHIKLKSRNSSFSNNSTENLDLSLKRKIKMLPPDLIAEQKEAGYTQLFSQSCRRDNKSTAE